MHNHFPLLSDDYKHKHNIESFIRSFLWRDCKLTSVAQMGDVCEYELKKKSKNGMAAKFSLKSSQV